MLKMLAVVSVMSLILVSCASVDVAKMKNLPAKPENCNLEVFSNAAEIKKPYEVACVLGSSTGTTLFADKSIQHAIDIAKPEACKCGADGILIENVAKTGMSLSGYGQGAASMKAIVFTEKK